MSNAAVIVAAGSGQRFGNAGKAFALAGGMPLAWWSLSAAAESSAIDELVLVCGEHSRAAARALLERFDSPKPVRLAIGGARRQDSARAGILSTSPLVDVVAIHDAARPLVVRELFDRSVEAAQLHGAAIVAVPVSDTIKRVTGEVVRETIPRDELVLVQTPQAFRKALLLEAFAAADSAGTSVTDEASLFESYGLPVRVVPGRTDNIKVTYPSDLTLAQAMLEMRSR